MQKRILLLGALSLIIIAALLVIFCSRVNRVNMAFAKDAEICFIYGDINSLHHLGDEELVLVREIFNNKKMYKDNPSCGFSENISIRFNKTQTFCIACDTCPIVYWKEKDSYIKLTEEEKTHLYDLLGSYGFFFPCL